MVMEWLRTQKKTWVMWNLQKFKSSTAFGGAKLSQSCEMGAIKTFITSKSVIKFLIIWEFINLVPIPIQRWNVCATLLPCNQIHLRYKKVDKVTSSKPKQWQVNTEAHRRQFVFNWFHRKSSSSLRHSLSGRIKLRTFIYGINLLSPSLAYRPSLSSGKTESWQNPLVARHSHSLDSLLFPVQQRLRVMWWRRHKQLWAKSNTIAHIHSFDPLKSWERE